MTLETTRQAHDAEVRRYDANGAEAPPHRRNRLRARAADDRSMMRLQCLDLRILRRKMRCTPGGHTGRQIDAYHALRRRLRAYTIAWAETRASIRDTEAAHD